MPPQKPKILVSEANGFSTDALSVLRQLGDVVLADLDRPALVSAVKDADVLWVRLRHTIDSQILAAAPRLKVIVTPTTGLNHIDLAGAAERGVTILSLRGETQFLQDVRATAEHTVALMLALLRRLPAAFLHVRGGGWNRDPFKGHELYGKMVGIVGYGRLGKIVARYLRAFDASVLVSDTGSSAEAAEAGIRMVPIEHLLQESDLVTLHVNLSEETRGFFGQSHFAAMKRGAWFINTSRGEVIDECALLNALRSGHLSGSALDVLCDEHSGGMNEHPLVEYARTNDNLIITPHIGGCTAESMQKTEMFLAEKLCASGARITFG